MPELKQNDGQDVTDEVMEELGFRYDDELEEWVIYCTSRGVEHPNYIPLTCDDVGGDWRFGSYCLSCVPKTRGQLRFMCELFGVKPAE